MKPKLIICVKHRAMNPDSCAGRGSQSLVEQFGTIIRQRNLAIDIETVHCLGQCKNGPNMRLAPGGEFFQGVGPEKVEEIIGKALAMGDSARS
ncbi:MAG: (2Fe-2S) ferredoxin domain-containing protein [Magnetococcales bacterium]|nr:(2Fe-2S) ferredoxin domain-containing protein [Magnetococcales bacterium]